MEWRATRPVDIARLNSGIFLAVLKQFGAVAAICAPIYFGGSSPSPRCGFHLPPFKVVTQIRFRANAVRCARSFRVMKGFRLLVASFLVVIAAGVLVVAETRPSSAPPASAVTTVSCEGSGLTGQPSPANLVLGPATFLGMGTAQGRQIQSGPRGLFADKAFLVVAPLGSGTTARITARAIGRGHAGLVYGTGPVAAWHNGSYRLDAAQSTYVLSLCQGEPSGFSGGIVTTGPACVQIGVTADHATSVTRLGFGGARCRSV